MTAMLLRLSSNLLPAMDQRSSDRGSIPARLHAEALGLASLLANETRDGVAIVGPHAELVFWNAAAGAITGWSSQAVAERNIAKLMQVPKALIEIRDGKWVEVRQAALDEWRSAPSVPRNPRVVRSA